MKTIHLQVQEDYLEELLKMLPHDKVKVLREDFVDLKEKFHKELDAYKSGTNTFALYHENMKEIDTWIKEGANQ